MYKTSDLYLAAYLKATGTPIEGTERKGRKVFFIFEDVSDQAVTDYFNDAMVAALSYKDSLQNLKTMIHNIGR